MASTKSLHFKGPYLRQNWSLPDFIIYSFTTNPSSAKAWQKLIQSCKYFFAKNAILVVDELFTDCVEKWNIVLFRVENGEKTRFSKIIDFKSVICKIWLTEIMLSYYYALPFDFVSSIIPYFYRCDIKTSKICNQEISYDQFKFIFSKVESIILYDCVVRNKNDEIVPLEKLVKVLPKIEKFTLTDSLISSSITSNTAEELLKIPHISKISDIFLCRLSETFDIEAFYTYLKKNEHTKFCIYFRNTISQAYKIRIEAIVDEIIATKNHDYQIPFVHFDGLPLKKQLKLDYIIETQTLANVRKEYWIHKARTTVRTVINNCYQCRKMNSNALENNNFVKGLKEKVINKSIDFNDFDDFFVENNSKRNRHKQFYS